MEGEQLGAAEGGKLESMMEGEQLSAEERLWTLRDESGRERSRATRRTRPPGRRSPAFGAVEAANFAARTGTHSPRHPQTATTPRA